MATDRPDPRLGAHTVSDRLLWFGEASADADTPLWSANAHGAYLLSEAPMHVAELAASTTAAVWITGTTVRRLWWSSGRAGDVEQLHPDTFGLVPSGLAAGDDSVLFWMSSPPPIAHVQSVAEPPQVWRVDADGALLHLATLDPPAHWPGAHDGAAPRAWQGVSFRGGPGLRDWAPGGLAERADGVYATLIANHPGHHACANGSVLYRIPYSSRRVLTSR